MSSYNKLIIEDYINFVEQLVEIEKLCNIDLENDFNFHNPEKDDVLKELTEIRLQDLYLKKKYENLANLIKVKLSEKQKIIQNKTEIWKKDEKRKGKFYIEHGMTRGSGLAGIIYFVTDEIGLGIQIQGEDYRMYIESTNTKIDSNLLDKLKGSEFWFKSEVFNGKILYPQVKNVENESQKQKKKEKTNKNFNQYNETFFYQYVKLETKYSVENVIDFVFSDMKFDKVKIEKIESILSKQLY